MCLAITYMTVYRQSWKVFLFNISKGIGNVADPSRLIKILINWYRSFAILIDSCVYYIVSLKSLSVSLSLSFSLSLPFIHSLTMQKIVISTGKINILNYFTKKVNKETWLLIINPISRLRWFNRSFLNRQLIAHYNSLILSFSEFLSCNVCVYFNSKKNIQGSVTRNPTRVKWYIDFYFNL